MILHAIITFFLTFFLLLIFYKLGGFRKYVNDHNKPKPRRVLTNGGFVVVLSLSLSYLLFLKGYVIYGIVGLIIIGGIIGLYDDFYMIRKWWKVPVLFIASIPLIFFYILYPKSFWEPIILGINFSNLYWFVLLPIIIAGFANGGNVIGGYDGMEVGIYTLISLLYIIIGIVENHMFIVYLSSILFSSLLAMLIFNWYPSRLIFGNVGSFPISALLGLIPLIGHFAIVLPIVFLPHLIEVLLQIKYTRKYNYNVFGVVDENGVIHNKYGIKSVLHWLISWGNMTEKKITLAMLGIEAALCVIAFFAWWLWEFFV